MPLFGESHDAAVRLNQLGEIVQRRWRTLPEHYEAVSLDVSIVMPVHFHGVLFLQDIQGHKSASYRDNLSVVIGGFKSFTAREINEVREWRGAVWQRGFFERVVRSERELRAIREYIANNPFKLALKCSGFPFD